MAHYGFDTTGDDIVSDFSDRVKNNTILITGPSPGGLGAETAISIARGFPATIILLGRSLPKVQPIIDSLHTISPSSLVKFFPVNLDSLSSVRTAAYQILQDAEIAKIDVTINNAAIMACPYSKTDDGLESQFAVNHVSHFLLTNLLMPKILASRAPRIVNVSSWGHLRSGIRFGDLDFNDGKEYDVWEAYGQAKTANILFSVALSERGIKSFAVHPGSIASGLQKFMTDDVAEEGLKSLLELGFQIPKRKTLQQGVATTLRAALDPELEVKEKEGRLWVYLSDCQVVRNENSVRADSLNVEQSRRLWELSEEMIGEKFGVRPNEEK
ncbi:putative retinol dehydrogenase 12 [Bisporella sp. PMI_857]|nr:putative retinol dehydrogenase 12 [Bisporella sp. PMI_857]